ncbi:MAG: restriction endonuclease subunit S [Anaerolineae bacterium]|nr:restriction endonuclease subunit S [Anaerolineae bacterium]
MGRIANACNDHITRWVIPAATRLLIESASKGIATQPLDKVVHIEMGQSPKSESYNTIQDGIPFIGGPADLGIKFPVTKRWANAPTKLCQTGDLIICVRATIGEPRWADGVYCLGRGVAGLRPADKNLDSGFLFRVIQANEQDLREKGTGTTFKTISKKHIAAIPIPMISLEVQRAISNFLEWLESSSGKGQFDFTEAPLLPASLTEQRRIVARIESLAAKVEAARELREAAAVQTKKLFSSAAGSIFTAKSNWKIARVGDFCAKPQYGYTESATSQPIGPRFLRITDIQNGQVNWDTVPFCNCPAPEKYLLRENDILFARTGATTGKSFLIKQCPEAVFASYLIRLRVKKWVTPEYLYLYFQSPSYWSQIIEQKKGTGQANVNGRKLADIQVPIAPEEEQRRIVAYLDALQAKVAAVQQQQATTQARLEALMPAILDQAFRGEL